LPSAGGGDGLGSGTESDPRSNGSRAISPRASGSPAASHTACYSNHRDGHIDADARSFLTD